MGAGRTAIFAATGVIVLGTGFLGAHFGRSAVEGIVRDYILEHPEILPQAMENLRRREAEEQLAGVRDVVEQPFPGAVLGNPGGKRTLVEFTDFACGFCRQSEADVQRLISEDPELKVVVRQLPVISPLSPEAAKMGLAAARQGKYARFHQAMFRAGQLDPAAIEAAARSAGMDMERARADLADPALEEELRKNIGIADRLGFSGTPSWIAGGQLLSGAVGHDALRNALRSSEDAPT
jgi:protein-disulfide isomerase